MPIASGPKKRFKLLLFTDFWSLWNIQNDILWIIFPIFFPEIIFLEIRDSSIFYVYICLKIWALVVLNLSVSAKIVSIIKSAYSCFLN